MTRTSRLHRSGLAAAVCATLLAACSSAPAASTEPTGGSTSPAEDATITIVDHTGEEVTIPADIERVAVDEIPIASTYIAYHEGAAPYLVGMSGAVVSALEDTVAAKMAPEVLEVESGYYDDGELNVESLLALDPDVVFYNARNTEHAALFEAAGIPAVGFATTGDPTTVYADWLRLLEDVFQEPGKMSETIEYGEQLVAEARERTATVADADLRDVMIVFASDGSGTLRVAGETPFFGSFWLQTANARNAAVGAVEPLAPVSAEQILAWDPDVVLVGGSGQARITPAEIVDGSAPGLDLSGLTAASTGSVYSNDLGMWSWFTPNPDAPLVASWLGAVVYPELFADVDLIGQTQEYYAQVYGYELSEQEATDIYQGSLAG